MKKKFFLLAVSILTLTACGNDEATDSKPETTGDVSVEKPVDTEENDSNSIDSKQTYFDTNLEEILDSRIMEEHQFIDFRRYELDDYFVETAYSGHGTIRLNAFYDKDNQLVSLVSNIDSRKIGNKAIAKQNTTIFEAFGESGRVEDYDLIEESIGDTHYTGVKTIDSDAEDFLIGFTDFVTEDMFLDDELNSEYEELLEAGRFSDIHALAKNYIEINNPNEFDSAYTIVKLTEEFVSIDDKLIYEFDNVENKFVYKHIDVTEINSQHAMVPRFENRNLYIDFGFYNSGWLFMDEIIISTSDDINRLTFKSYNVDTDILNGGSIFEKYTASNFMYIDEILNSDETIIRFKGSNGEIDHVVTEAEKEALDYLTSFDGLYVELANFQYHFFKW